MSRFDALRGDVAVLARLARGMPRASSHAQALGTFYGAQSAHYDRFRERLLQGRAELIGSLELPPQARVVELGGGTGRNAEFFGERLAQIESITIVDLCAPLLARARARAVRIAQLRTVEADATTWQPAEPVDAVILSYALTMIPDWRAAIENAISMLKPGGMLGVVDFYVSQAGAKGVRHGAFTRRFWPAWFAHDGVRLNEQHLPMLRRRLSDHEIFEARAAVPYMPFGRVPYFRFVGRNAG
ncbi:MAG: class I SAM-dependent methyltransferase [Dokdonella sp.]